MSSSQERSTKANARLPTSSGAKAATRSSPLSRLLRPDWFWLAALVLVVSFHFWFPFRTRGPSHDTYGTSIDGKKAFYLLVERLDEERGIAVERSDQPLSRVVGGTPVWRLGDSLGTVRPVLCLLGPERYPTSAEWDALLHWVSAGGTLVIAARDDDPEFEIPELNLRVQPVSDAGYGSGQLQTWLPEGRFYWESFGEIVDPSTETLISYGGSPQAAVRPHGRGRVVAIASDFIFSNPSLAWDDNARLAYALLHAPAIGGEPTRIVFDESLNVSGLPRIVALLFDPVFRPATVQILALLLLFGWWESRRFGPLLPGSLAARHNIVDHTDTVGLHAWKARDGGTVLAGYLNQLTTELRLHRFPGQEDRVLAPVAMRLGKDVSVIQRLLDRAGKAAQLKRLDRRAAAAFIRRLAIIRRAARAPAR